MADKIYYVIGNSALIRIPNPFAGIEGEETYLSPPEINFDTSTNIGISGLSETSTLNIVIFEPLYFAGGRVNIDKYKEKPRKFSLEGKIIGKTVREVEKYKYYLEVITKYPENSGGIDIELSKMLNQEVPALYIRKVYSSDGETIKTWEIRGFREELSFSVIPELGYRGCSFSLSITALYPVWKEV